MEDPNLLNLLLIDSRLKNVNLILDSIELSKTKYVIIDYESDTLESIKQNINNLGLNNITSVGVLQENYNEPTYQFAKSFGQSQLIDVETLDKELYSWSQYVNLLEHLKTLGMSNLDLMGCSIGSDSNWNYIINKLKSDLSISIETSVDNTGSAVLGGNWILESNNSNMVNKYFNSQIYNYQHILGSSSLTLPNPMVLLNGTALLVGGMTPQYFKDENGNRLNGIVTVTMGGSNTFYALKNDGSVYVMGSNKGNSSDSVVGLLGQGSSDPSLTLTNGSKIKISATEYVTNAVQVEASDDYYAILLANGKVLVGGSNANGRTGQNTTEGNLLYATYLKDSTGTGQMENISKIALGKDWMLMIDKHFSARLWGCGNDKYKIQSASGNVLLPTQVKKADGTFVIGATQIACGDDHEIIIASGMVFAGGSNTYGQLGNGTTTDSLPTRMKSSATINLGYNTSFISAGLSSSCLVVGDNGGNMTLPVSGVYYCGRNLKGQSSDGSTTQKNYLTRMKYSNGNFIFGNLMPTGVRMVELYPNRTGLLFNDGSYKCLGDFQAIPGYSTDQYYPVDYTVSGVPIKDVYSISSRHNNIFYAKSTGANYNNINLLGSTFMDRIMAGYTASDFKLTGAPIASLKASFSISQLLLAGYTINDMLMNSTYTISELKTAGITLTQFKNAGYTNANQLKTGGFTVPELKAGGFTVSQLSMDGISLQEIKDANYTASDFKLGLIQVSSILKTLFTIDELKNGGYQLNQLSNAFTISELKQSGFNASDFKNNSWAESTVYSYFSIQELKDGGYNNDSNIIKSGYTALQLKTGYSLSDIILYKNGSISDKIVFLSEGYSISEIVNGQSNWSLNTVLQFYPASLSKLQGYSVSDLRLAGASYNNVTSGFTITEVKNGGYPENQIKNVLASGNYPIADLVAEGFTLADFKNFNFAVSRLSPTYLISDLKGVGYTDSQILSKDSGYSIANYKTANYTVVNLAMAGYDFTDIKNGGYQASDFKYYNFSVNSLRTVFSIQQLKEGGYQDNQILATNSGYSMSDYKNALYNIPTLLGASYSLAQIATAFSVADFRAAGYSPLDLKNNNIASFSAMLAGGYSLSDFRLSNYNINTLRLEITVSIDDAKAAGYTSSQIIMNGAYTVSELINIGGYNASDFFAAGFSANLLYGFISFSQLKAAGYGDGTLLMAGFTVDEFKAIGYTASTFKSSNTPLSLIASGFSIQQLKLGGYSDNDVFMNPNYSGTDLRAAGYSASDLFSANVSVSKLKTAFTIQEIKAGGYTDTQIIQGGGLLAGDYKAFGYSAATLKSFNIGVNVLGFVYSVAELREGGYQDSEIVVMTGYNPVTREKTGISVADLVTAGFTLTNFKGNNYPALVLTKSFNPGQLQQVGYLNSDILAAGYPPSVLKSYFSVSELKGALFTASELKSEYSVAQLKAGGYTANNLSGSFTIQELVSGNFGAQDLKDAGYSISQLVSHFSTAQLEQAGFSSTEIANASQPIASVEDLIAQNYNVLQIKNAGYGLAALKSHFSIQALKSAFTDLQIITGGYQISELRNGGYTPKNLVDNGVDINNLRSGGYTAEQMRLSLYNINTLQQLGYNDSEIIGGGYSVIQLRDANYSANLLHNTYNYTGQQLKQAGYLVSDMRSANFNLTTLIGLGYNATQLKAGQFNVSELKQANMPKDSILKAGYGVTDLNSENFTPQQMKNANYTFRQLFESTLYSVPQLKNAGFKAIDLKNSSYQVDEIITKGYTIKNIKAAQFTVQELRAKNINPLILLGTYTLREIKQGGYTIQEMSSATLDGVQFTGTQLKNAGYSALELKSIGYNLNQLVSLKYTPKNLKDANYNASDLSSVGISNRVLRHIGLI